MKHYLITGGTGLIGSALCRSLIAQGDQVTVLSRSIEKVKVRCGDNVTPIRSLYTINNQTKIDVIVNLAGEPIADKRWSVEQKAVLEQSRIEVTHSLIQWISQRPSKPDCLISGSAVGWYGDQGNNDVTEQTTFNQEYTHDLCEQWEQQAMRAAQLNVRVCLLRTGLVLSSKGGFLEKMLPPFKLGLGGKLGTGQQFMPWIHINDMVNIIVFLANNDQLKGIFNTCSPNPVNNEVFTQALARQLNRPAFFSVPSFVLNTLLGEMSRLLLTGQRAKPENLTANGFEFIYTDINEALADVIHP
jgi:uncharacterized protein (TIGR01777 family)